LRHYEVMVILDAGLEEDAIRGIVDRTTKLLTDAGGSVGKVDRWGKRRFAYEVHHKSEGYYVLVDTTAEPSALSAVDRMLGLTDEVIRHKVVRLPDRAAVTVAPRPAASDGAPGEANANGDS
jgi:small subunit ribosomal protein S6